MLTLYKAAAECDFLPCAELPPDCKLGFAVSTFGLEDFNTGLLCRYFHKDLDCMVVSLITESGDEYISKYPRKPWIEAVSHNDFLSAIKLMVSLCFCKDNKIQTIVSSLSMELQ